MNLLFLLVFMTEVPVHGTYALDKANFRDITIRQMQEKLGTELNENQLAVVDQEVARLVVTITLKEKGRAAFHIDVGDGLPQKGLANWSIDGTDIELIITHMFGLRLEKKRVLAGKFLNYTIFMELAEGLPMLSLKLQPPEESETPEP